MIIVSICCGAFISIISATLEYISGNVEGNIVISFEIHPP